jgi:death-on-curing protein
VTRYLSLAEFWCLAEHVTGINAATLIEASRVELAYSALHAPRPALRAADRRRLHQDSSAPLAGIEPATHGLGIVPCPSGWCGRIRESP